MMTQTLRRLGGLIVLSLLAGTSLAQAEASGTKLATVRAAHAELEKTRSELNAAQQPLLVEYRKAERGSAEQRELGKKLTELRDRQKAPHEAFVAAMKAADWSKLDLTEDAALLKDGLPLLANDDEDPERAIEAARYFLEHFGDERSATTIKSRSLPNALLAAGQPEAACELLQDAADAASGPAKARLLLTLGDIAAATGDVEKAQSLFAKAETHADERTMGYVTLRKELVGKPAPDIEDAQWIGHDASSLSKLQGKVVLVDFWATWCGPCRNVMPALNEMFKEHADAGLQVIGVTRFYANGYMAADPSQMVSGGESVRGMTEETFTDHVTTFRNNTGITYPFVIGKQADFQNYHVRGIPTLAVVDRAGKVAMVTVGSGSEGLLKFAVGRLLAK